MQRAAHIAANEILWAASKHLESVKKEVDDEVIVAQVTEPTGHHPTRPPSSMEDDVFLPNTHDSATDPLEVTTSIEAIFLPKNTGVVREQIKVVADGHEVDGYVVSLSCSRCSFKTAKLKKRKAKRRISTQPQRPPTNRHGQQWCGPHRELP